tara:strand:+ start:1949 stop:2245 length:297 start_codon:yes stop_codon:yes gene_type:complete
MADKDKKKNTRSRRNRRGSGMRGRTKVKVKVKTGSSQKQPSLMRQLLSAGLGGLTGLFANRVMGPGFSGSIDPQIKTVVNDRKSRLPVGKTVNTKTGA